MTPPSSQPSGILLINKPIDWSSHRVVNFIRKATGVSRVGHTGTLDPFATGLLIILVGREYTKQQDLFLKQDKTYECQFELGYETTTLDSSGEITKRCEKSELPLITQTKLDAVLRSFIGKQQQRPPAFSAIKQSGDTLYHHALELLHQPDGHTALENWQATLPTRTVTIYDIALKSFTASDSTHEYPKVQITVSCSSGTYIRSLIRDIGTALATYATATTLKRTSIGTISLTSANSIETPSTQWRWYKQN